MESDTLSFVKESPPNRFTAVLKELVCFTSIPGVNIHSSVAIFLVATTTPLQRNNLIAFFKTFQKNAHLESYHVPWGTDIHYDLLRKQKEESVIRIPEKEEQLYLKIFFLKKECPPVGKTLRLELLLNLEVCEITCRFTSHLNPDVRVADYQQYLIDEQTRLLGEYHYTPSDDEHLYDDEKDLCHDVDEQLLLNHSFQNLSMNHSNSKRLIEEEEEEEEEDSDLIQEETNHSTRTKRKQLRKLERNKKELMELHGMLQDIVADTLLTIDEIMVDIMSLNECEE